MTESPPQRRPLRLRIFSQEGALAAFGLFSLGSGLWQGELIPAFWGVTILTGLLVLLAMRRRDWKHHWETLENQRSAPPPQDPGPPDA